jgi:predicted HAD superfamily Cof-like phosphohydrolase
VDHQERERISLGGKRTECPLCRFSEEEGHAKCFHCTTCGYLQCCDYNGYYNRHIEYYNRFLKITGKRNTTGMYTELTEQRINQIAKAITGWIESDGGCEGPSEETLKQIIRENAGGAKPYEPQGAVAEMMNLFGQKVRVTPQMIEDPKERLLTTNLVWEETLEFVKAMGFDIAFTDGGITFSISKSTPLSLVPSAQAPDLVEAADGIGDILVVTYGAANRLGINAQAVFDEVHRSNMTKVWPDGTVHRREYDGKVLKPDTYSPANIAGVLETLAA